MLTLDRSETKKNTFTYLFGVILYLVDVLRREKE